MLKLLKTDFSYFKLHVISAYVLMILVFMTLALEEAEEFETYLDVTFVVLVCYMALFQVRKWHEKRDRHITGLPLSIALLGLYRIFFLTVFVVLGYLLIILYIVLFNPEGLPENLLDLMIYSFAKTMLFLSAMSFVSEIKQMKFTKLKRMIISVPAGIFVWVILISLMGYQYYPTLSKELGVGFFSDYILTPLHNILSTGPLFVIAVSIIILNVTYFVRRRSYTFT